MRFMEFFFKMKVIEEVVGIAFLILLALVVSIIVLKCKIEEHKDKKKEDNKKNNA